jgi:hypothetical protein
MCVPVPSTSSTHHFSIPTSMKTVYVHALLAASVAAQKLNFVGDTGVADMSFNRPTNGTDLAMDLELQGCPTGDFSL